ncbi:MULTISPECIES: large exoprotein [Microbacterium]|jgi:hypothetical protein|uniref:large exoprotein n=1 Tax=Microbacterium TaxID=33882 RepID=UPI001D178526|nr:large exoprotein [Microbacterium testaceum]MCC4249151.1 large exoprotein [Microbacterium testaceum]
MGGSYYYDDGSGFAAFAFFLFLLPILLIFVLAGYVIGAFLLMKVFEKAGVQGKWRAWVPVYNMLIAAKLGDLSPWVYLGAVVISGLLVNIPIIGWLIGLLGVAAAVMFGYRLGLKFGKDWPYLLLWLIPGVGYFIWLGILAFGSSPWNPHIQPAPWANSFLADKTVWNGVPVQPGQQVQAPPAGGYGAPTGGYAPPAQPYDPPQTPPAAGTTPPPAGPTPPPPAGPQV